MNASSSIATALRNTETDSYADDTRRFRLPTDLTSRGTCANRQSLREDTARAAVLDELRHQLRRPAGVTYIRREVARRLGESFRGIGAELTKAQQTIGKLDTQIGNLVGFIASGNASEAVALNLNALEAKVGRAALHRLFKGSRLKCEPGEAGYRLHGDLMPLMVVAENATADPEQLGSAIYASSSGDPLRTLYTAMTLPFSARLVA